MFQLNTARIAQNPDPMQCYRDMIVAALNAKGLVPAAPPALSGFPGYVHRYNVKALTLEQEEGLWSYCLHLERVPSGMPNCIGLPPEFRCETSIQAFMAGAELLCLIYTGEEDLPFFAVGNTLMFTAYGPGTAA